MSDLVSIVIPVFNVEKYLSRCLDSVRNQTYKNIEVIIIDDGSTDRSGEICDNYSILDNRFIVIHKQNSGVSISRNIGLNIVKGDYVCFIDSDDWVEHDLIETLLESAIISNSQMSVCGYCEYNEEKFIKEVVFKPGVYRKDEIIKMNIDGEIMVAPWGKIYKYASIKDIRFPLNIIYEDILFTAEALNNINQCIVINVSKYNYRYNRLGSTSGLGFNEKSITDELPSYYKRLEYLISHTNMSIANLDFDKFVSRLRAYNYRVFISKTINKKESYKYIKIYAKKALNLKIRSSFMNKFKLYLLCFHPINYNIFIRIKRLLKNILIMYNY